MNDLFDYLLAIQKGGGGGGGEADIFVAEYNETTFQVIRNALNAGKLCIVKRNVITSVGNVTYYYVPLEDSPDAYFFSAIIGNTQETVRVKSTGNEWSMTSVTLQEESNLVGEITSQSTNTKYPSAKAVYDFVMAREEIAFAYYNVSTYSEVLYKLTISKLVLMQLDYNEEIYISQAVFPGETDGNIYFFAVASDAILKATLESNSNWSFETIPLTSGAAIMYAEPNTTTFMEIVEAVQASRVPVINAADGSIYYVSGYTMSGDDPVAIRFCTLEKNDSGLRYTWTVDYQDNWSSGSYTDGLYYVVPGTTTFMDIVGLLTKCTQPVINDTVNGRAYYISDYTMVGGQPAAITFSTIGANTPHTWTVDYQDNWTST